MSDNRPIDNAGPSCPGCNSRELVPILYGYPSEGAFDAAARGEVALGGCCIRGDDPQWICRACGRRFRVAEG